MKKTIMMLMLLCLCLSPFAFCPVSASAEDAPAAPAITTQPATDMLQPITALGEKVKIEGAKIKLDGHILFGQLFDVQKEEIGDYDRVNLTSKRGSYLVDVEFGARYGMIRLFGTYKALTDVYDTKTAGMDVFLYSSHGVSCGVRGAYAINRRIDVDKQTSIMAATLCVW